MFIQIVQKLINNCHCWKSALVCVHIQFNIYIYAVDDRMDWYVVSVLISELI